MVSEGVHDTSMWHMMLTVDLLKHGIPDPSSLTFSHPQSSTMSADKEKDKLLEGGDEYIAAPVFVHTRLRDGDVTPQNFVQMKKALALGFSSSSFMRLKCRDASKEAHSSDTQNDDLDANLKLFIIPSKGRDDSSRPQYESYLSMLWKVRDQVLSTGTPSFSRIVSERDWLKNSAKIWEQVKNSPIIADYCRTLQSSGLFKK